MKIRSLHVGAKSFCHLICRTDPESGLFKLLGNHFVDISKEIITENSDFFFSLGKVGGGGGGRKTKPKTTQQKTTTNKTQHLNY